MKIALVGNQNSGKSTLFNTLTGDNQKIGNWPGVTVEKKVGIIKNTDFELIDLPGIYSLKPYTDEEEITTKFIEKEKVDIFINIIDCNSISRGLYLTTQLLDLNKNIIVVLNMHNIAEKKGIFVNEEKLSQNLRGIPVLKISAISGEGSSEIIKNIKKYASQNRLNTEKNNLEKNEDKLFFEEDDIEKRYYFVDTVVSQSVRKNKLKRENITDKLDKIFLNKYLAILIFTIIMLIIYYFSIDIVGNNTTDIINNWIKFFSERLTLFLNKNNTSPVLISLVVDGIITGVSSVISFLPQLIFLFILISYLEKVGYMSRISLIFDKFFRKLGISGNSIISFIIGTGCSVPALMATKTIKNKKEKEITAAITPFIPCSAKLPIISLFSTYFFKEKSGIVAISFYILGIIIIIISSLLLKRINRLPSEPSYISELPEFRLPKLKHIFKDSYERVLDFIKRAGSIILISSITVWILVSYSLNINNTENKLMKFNFEYGQGIEKSILAEIGRTFSWIFIPIVGENSWEIAVSSIQGLIAKEQVISSMSIIAGLETENVTDSIFLDKSPFDFFTPVSAYAFACFNLFSAPCFGAIGAMRKVLGNTVKTIKVVMYQFMLSYVISIFIYSVGNLII